MDSTRNSRIRQPDPKMYDPESESGTSATMGVTPGGVRGLQPPRIWGEGVANVLQPPIMSWNPWLIHHGNPPTVWHRVTPMPNSTQRMQHLVEWAQYHDPSRWMGSENVPIQHCFRQRKATKTVSFSFFSNSCSQTSLKRMFHRVTGCSEVLFQFTTFKPK